MTTAISMRFAVEANAEMGFRLGEWVWHDVQAKNGASERVLCCVMHVGSNYYRVNEAGLADGNYGPREWRVHFNQSDNLSAAPDGASWLAERQARAGGAAQSALDRLNAAMAQLGFDRANALAGPVAGAESGALVVLNQSNDPKRYRDQLVAAKKETIPGLTKDVEQAHRWMSEWLGASALPFKAQTGDMKRHIAAIDDRLFVISIYAGLIEDAVKIADGAPATAHEKLHVFQRRRYMDEECLAAYEAGGMDFKDIEDFDAWLARPDNRDRILSHPRSLVAFRVRRWTKERDNAIDGYIRLQLDCQDKLTFFYARNGEQIWRVQTEIDFPENIVPDKSFYDPSQPMMIYKAWSTRRKTIIPKSEYDDAVRRYDEYNAKLAARKEAGEKIDMWNERRMSLRDDHNFNPSNWDLVSPDSVYFDDAMEQIGEQAKTYNRIAVLVQGLLDRSEVFHPHPRIQIWNPDHFERFIEIVYDGSAVLYEGDKPDFEAYRRRLNASIDASSFLIGQEEAWITRATDEENKRRVKDARRGRYDFRPTNRHVPRRDLDPGPGRVRKADRWNARERMATFDWRRRHANASSWRDDGVRTKDSIKVHVDKLLNVSAYKRGDFRIFYADPRTRAEYLEWAPLLLGAEDHHAAAKAAKPNEDQP